MDVIETEHPVYQVFVKGVHVVYMDVFGKWCKENCDDAFHMKNNNTSFDDSAYILITFISEEDAMAFKLRWS